MGKKACKKENFDDKENPKYGCEKCGAEVKKKEKVCKAKKIISNSNLKAPNFK